MLATDTPDMADRGEMALGGGPGISLYSFHGRGTLNGLIPHPALVALAAEAAGEVCLWRRARIETDLEFIWPEARGREPALAAIIELVRESWPEGPGKSKPEGQRAVAAAAR